MPTVVDNLTDGEQKCLNQGGSEQLQNDINCICYQIIEHGDF